MIRGTNNLIGAVNFITFLASIPILGGGIWLSIRANSTECLRFLQWPIIIIGIVIMVVSLMGFVGACYRQTWLLQLYLFVMFLVIAALICFIVFAFAVTDRGHGQVVFNRAFLEYQLSDYSGWLKDRVRDPHYWRKISSCLRDAHACSGMRRTVRDPATGILVPESADMFYQRKLSPIESGCCKPPSSCGYTYVNETFWTASAGMVVNDIDCTRWSNDQQQLCYHCASCKARYPSSTSSSSSSSSCMSWDVPLTETTRGWITMRPMGRLECQRQGRYEVALMYTIMKMEQQNTTSKEGVEILENIPFEDEEHGEGQYTSKLYHLERSQQPHWS